VPTIAIVDGVALMIYPKDHLPPHLHARFGEYEAMISILSGDILQGSLPRAKTVAVQRWLAAHRGEVAAKWESITGLGPRGGRRG
jgi:hypothetical protein